MATKANPLSYLNFWEEAASLEIGLFVECATERDKRLLVNALYECRKQTGGFDDLMTFQPHPSNVLYIAKRTKRPTPRTCPFMEPLNMTPSS